MGKTFIASGRLKGCAIQVPKGIRPTQERVRKALFDILQQEIAGVAFLELYAGSGAVGLEAFSHGAERVVFVEEDRQCVRFLAQNIKATLVATQTQDQQLLRAVTANARCGLDILAHDNERFGVVFLDPPYYGDEAKKTLQKLSTHDIVSPHCSIIVEHHKRDISDDEIENLTLFKQKRYGDTVLSFYSRSN